MPRLQRRSFANAEEVRRFPNGELRLVTFDDIVFGNFLFQPGWRWSNDVRPIAGTAQCEHRHIGFVVSGQLHIQMNDGATMDFVPGDIYEIPPGHDAWVVGDTRWRAIRVVRALAGIEHVTLEDRDAVLAALAAFDKGLGFADALHIARSSRASGFATFDQRLAKRAKALALAPGVELLA